MKTSYRIFDIYPWLDREDEHPGLTLDEAAALMDDLTGVGADTILSDWDEPCETCRGLGRWTRSGCFGVTFDPMAHRCMDCGGTGKWIGPWKWIDDETGREVTMWREIAVEAGAMSSTDGLGSDPAPS